MELIAEDGADDPSLRPGRHVLFFVVSRALLGRDTLAVRWLWTWDEQAAGPAIDGLRAQWRGDRAGTTADAPGSALSAGPRGGTPGVRGRRFDPTI